MIYGSNTIVMKKRTLFAPLAILSAGLLLVAGCAKNALNHLTTEESRIYITNRDSTAAFNAYKTYSIVDSVAVIQNNQQYTKELTPGDAQLLQNIKDQMAARGYMLVDSKSDPDLGINVSLISNAYLNVVQYPYDWWNTPGYWDPGYWGYGGYSYYFPPAFGYYQTREDIMTIDIIDLKNAGQEEQLTGIWNATLRGEQVLNPDNYASEVKAVFDQSPYLKTNS